MNITMSMYDGDSDGDGDGNHGNVVGGAAVRGGGKEGASGRHVFFLLTCCIDYIPLQRNRKGNGEREDWNRADVVDGGPRTGVLPYMSVAQFEWATESSGHSRKALLFCHYHTVFFNFSLSLTCGVQL